MELASSTMPQSWQSGRCFYCGNPLRQRQLELDRKENEGLHPDTVFHAAESSRGPQAQEAVRNEATEIAPFLLFVVDGVMKDPENSRRNKILWIVFAVRKLIETKGVRKSSLQNWNREKSRN